MNCIEVVKGETTLSSLFRSCRGEIRVGFHRCLLQGVCQERETLWRELEECRRKWGENWIVVGIST